MNGNLQVFMLISPEYIVLLGLGTNLGDRRANLEKAILRVEEKCGPILKRSSHISVVVTEEGV